ncbi:hypothetical protein [Sphingobacterium sp. BN32]|uniref:hypothetical protein n=1 Tax=Sphingobacterium sp. BN32 TaxID=3058432 RepID=UPI00265D58C0|nr:hypothetical protein [Sphingobacterium sp. BN32]WKK57440.1 hypothetical protein QYC40_12410 [Sphingobacterium sp. BN32]
MALLQKGKSNYPFWGASINLITGLDPLGLQTTSEATYATMLPGISNLTNRLRYYGFYCWLLDFYFKTEKKGNSKEQYRFIRRAELMIAIIMQSQRKAVQQITGSNFASNLLNTIENDYFDLAEGADKDGTDKNVYWKYPSGAFGQYYYGAMQALSLIITAVNDFGDVVYNISQPHPRQKVSGKQLANAFEISLSPQIKDLFYSNIKKGKLYQSDIPELIKYFAIETIETESSEWQLYMEMLLDKDEPSQEVEELVTFHRRETILSLIKTAVQNDNDYNWYKFLLESYHKKLGSSTQPETETNIGWYCYQLNEYWQYSCGTIFWALLQHLYDFQQDQYLPSFVEKFSDSISKEICKDFNQSIQPTSLVSEILSLIPDTNDEEETKRAINQTNDPILAGKYGFMLLLQLFKNNREQLHPLKEFMSRKRTERDGNMVDGILTVHKAEKEILKDFVEQFILRKIIYRHTMVALRKMGNGSQSTHKFFIEEQYIRFIDIFPPRNTSPRMNALQNIMFDLQVIDEEKVLSPLHTKLLVD